MITVPNYSRNFTKMDPNMRGRRNWWPCRVCGAQHTNPQSSSICPECGIKERNRNLELEQERLKNRNGDPFERFMDLPEEDRWRKVFDALNLCD